MADGQQVPLHTLVLSRWSRIQPEILASSEDAMACDWGACLHERSLNEALRSKSSSGGGGKYGKGSKERADPTDTYCEHHKMYYPKDKSHTTKNCSKGKAAADKAKSAGGAAGGSGSS